MVPPTSRAFRTSDLRSFMGHLSVFESAEGLWATADRPERNRLRATIEDSLEETDSPAQFVCDMGIQQCLNVTYKNSLSYTGTKVCYRKSKREKQSQAVERE